MPTILRALGPANRTGSDRFIVEVDGRPVGLIVRDGDGCEFLASSAPAFALNRRRFAGIGEAEAAIRRTLRIA